MMFFAFIDPITARNIILIVLGGIYAGYHLIPLLRRLHAAMERAKENALNEKMFEYLTENGDAALESENAEAAEDSTEVPNAAKEGVSESEKAQLPAASPQVADQVAAPSPSLLGSLEEKDADDSPSPLGEEFFNQARAMPHQSIPDFAMDEEYLNLLGKSAALGYAPALAKLGDYAIRREAWVEAYYWLWLAKRHGMKNVITTLHEIQRTWILEDFPDEFENTHALFSVEAGSIGRALLNLDSGHDAFSARKFLKAHHPEFLK